MFFHLGWRDTLGQRFAHRHHAGQREADPFGLARGAGGVGDLGSALWQCREVCRFAAPERQFAADQQERLGGVPSLMGRANQRIGTAALQQPLLLLKAEEVGHRYDHDPGFGAGQIHQRPWQAVVELQGKALDASLLQLASQMLDLLPEAVVVEPLLAAQQRRRLRILAGMFGDGVEQAHWAHLFSLVRVASVKSTGMGASRLSSRLLWASTARP